MHFGLIHRSIYTPIGPTCWVYKYPPQTAVPFRSKDTHVLYWGIVGDPGPTLLTVSEREREREREEIDRERVRWTGKERAEIER